MQQVIQQGLRAIGDAVGDALYTLIWLPLVALPRRVWRTLLGPAPRLRQVVRTLIPHILLLLGMGLIRYMQAVSGRPSLLPEFLGPGRARMAVSVGHISHSLSQYSQWALRYTGDLLLDLHDLAPPVASLVTGVLAWLMAAMAATLFCGPLHLMFFDSRSRRLLQMPIQPLLGLARQTQVRLARSRAQSRGRWLVGFSGPLQLLPVTAALDAPIWVLGGADRRGNGIPFITLLRAHALAGRSIVVVDTLNSVTVQEDVKRCAAAAGREANFRAVSGPVPPGYFTEAYGRDAVVYVGVARPVDTSQVDAAQDEAARQLLSHLVEAGKMLPADAQWVVAVTDAAEMPNLASSGLISLESVLPLMALHRLDHENASWAYEFRQGTWLLLPVRTAAESQLLVSLSKSEAAGKLRPDTALLVQNGDPTLVDRIDKFRSL